MPVKHEPFVSPFHTKKTVPFTALLHITPFMYIIASGTSVLFLSPTPLGGGSKVRSARKLLTIGTLGNIWVSIASGIGVGSEKFGPVKQQTDSRLLTPETQQWVTWADLVKRSTGFKN